MRPLVIRSTAISGFVIGLSLVLIIGPKLRHVLSQDQYTQTAYVTYQFNVLKHPTGLAYSPYIFALGNLCGSYAQHLFIADTGNHLIRVFNVSTGSLCTLAGNGTAGNVTGTSLSTAEFNNPTGIEVLNGGATVNGNHYYWNIIYVSDSSNYVLRYFCTGSPYHDSRCPTSFGVPTWAGSGTKGYVNGSLTTAQFAHVGGMHASLGYAVDMENHAIRTVSSSVGTFAGTGNPGFVNGYRTSALFNFPTKLTQDIGGNMYVTDTGNYVIRKIDTSGNVTTFAGTGHNGFVDGAGAQASFRHPTGIAFNPADGYLYVVDTENNAIRRIDSSGNVSTYAGTGVAGLTNGSLSQAQFFAPTDLVIVNGIMFVSDSSNNVIRKIDMTNQVVSTYIS